MPLGMRDRLLRVDEDMLLGAEADTPLAVATPLLTRCHNKDRPPIQTSSLCHSRNNGPDLPP